MPTSTARNITLELWHQRPGGSTPAVEAVKARQWLDSWAIDDVGRSALRCAVLGLADGTELSRLDDAQLKDHLSAALSAGRLSSGAGKPLVLRRLTQAALPAAPAPPSLAPPASSPRAAPADAAETTFALDLDVAAQVAVLVQAAQNGVPFCEECAKAAAKRALEPVAV